MQNEAPHCSQAHGCSERRAVNADLQQSNPRHGLLLPWPTSPFPGLCKSGCGCAQGMNALPALLAQAAMPSAPGPAAQAPAVPTHLAQSGLPRPAEPSICRYASAAARQPTCPPSDYKGCLPLTQVQLLCPQVFTWYPDPCAQPAWTGRTAHMDVLTCNPHTAHVDVRTAHMGRAGCCLLASLAKSAGRPPLALASLRLLLSLRLVVMLATTGSRSQLSLCLSGRSPMQGWIPRSKCCPGSVAVVLRMQRGRRAARAPPQALCRRLRLDEVVELDGFLPRPPRAVRP